MDNPYNNPIPQQTNSRNHGGCRGSGGSWRFQGAGDTRIVEALHIRNQRPKMVWLSVKPSGRGQKLFFYQWIGFHGKVYRKAPYWMENLWFPVGFPLKTINFSRKRGDKNIWHKQLSGLQTLLAPLAPHLQVLDVGKHHNTDKKNAHSKPIPIMSII